MIKFSEWSKVNLLGQKSAQCSPLWSLLTFHISRKNYVLIMAIIILIYVLAGQRRFNKYLYILAGNVATNHKALVNI